MRVREQRPHITLVRHSDEKRIAQERTFSISALKGQIGSGVAKPKQLRNS
jgi:hypothetical protein